MDVPVDLENWKNLSVHEAIELFLATIIATISFIFIAANLLGHNNLVISLSAVFYSIVPVSIAVIAFLTYRVIRILYDSNKFGQNSLSAVLAALILAITALNIGFMVLVATGPLLLEGSMGVLKISLLIVILSLALSVSVIIRCLTDINEQ
jgi:hypothetical protein